MHPAAAGIILAVILILIGLAGYRYMNRPQSDPIADAVAKQRSQGQAVSKIGAPLIGSPPKAGASDYAPANMSANSKR